MNMSDETVSVTILCPEHGKQNLVDNPENKNGYICEKCLKKL